MVKSDLEQKFFMLHVIEENWKERPTPLREKKIKELKHEIRSFMKRNELENEKVVVQDGGMDGYTVRYPVPGWCETIDDMIEWFEEEERLRYRPSMYDCTGQAFTCWYEFHKLQGKMWVWHSVAYDV